MFDTAIKIRTWDGRRKLGGTWRRSRQWWMSWWWQSSWTAPPDTPSPAPSPRRSPPRPPPLPLIHFLNSPPQVPLCSHLLVSQSCTGKKWIIWFCFSICYVCSIATFSRSFWRIASRSSSCFLEKLDFQLWDDFLFLSFHKSMSWHDHLSLAPVLFFSLLFCKSSIAAVVIVTGKPRECLGI